MLTSTNSYLMQTREGYRVETYDQAKTNHSAKFLDEKCGICLGIFKEHHDIAVFDCGHGIHNKCMKSYQFTKCPYDNIDLSCEITLLGKTIFFPSKTKEWGRLLAKKQDEINEIISEQIIQKFSGNSLIEEKALEAFRILIQSCIDSYEEKLSPEEMDEEISAFFNTCITLIYRETKEETRKNIKRLYEDYEIDLFELKSKQKKLSEEIALLLIYGLTMNELQINSSGLNCLKYFLEKLFKAIFESPQYSQIATEFDLLFVEHHTNQIKRFNSENEIYQYLKNQTPESLKRLRSKIQTENECSIKIQQQITKIKKHRAIIKELPKLAYGALVITIPFVSNTGTVGDTIYNIIGAIILAWSLHSIYKDIKI